MRVGEVFEKTISGSGIEALDVIRSQFDNWKRDRERKLTPGFYFQCSTAMHMDGLLHEAVARGTMSLTVAEDR